MKIELREEKKPSYDTIGDYIRFSIIGERKSNSLEIPLWEKTIFISELENLNPDVIKELKKDNALAVFEKFYQDIFTK